MSKISYYTPDGLKKLKDELNHLKDVERPKYFQRLDRLLINSYHTIILYLLEAYIVVLLY